MVSVSPSATGLYKLKLRAVPTPSSVSDRADRIPVYKLLTPSIDSARRMMKIFLAIKPRRAVISVLVYPKNMLRTVFLIRPSCLFDI